MLELLCTGLRLTERLLTPKSPSPVAGFFIWASTVMDLYLPLPDQAHRGIIDLNTPEGEAGMIARFHEEGTK